MNAGSVPPTAAMPENCSAFSLWSRRTAPPSLSRSSSRGRNAMKAFDHSSYVLPG